MDLRPHLQALLAYDQPYGATWLAIAVNLPTLSVDLSLADPDGQAVVEIIASDSLHTASLSVGPFAVPE